MNTNLNCNSPTVAYESYTPEKITELVRDNDRSILERFLPLVRAKNVALDLGAVTRIDAAGLATLIRLYCAAREAGRSFIVANPSSHVAEILRLVGLDRVLAFGDEGETPFLGERLVVTAA